MAMVLVVAGFVGAGVWVAMRLERGLDTAATVTREVAGDRPRGLRGGCRTARRAYPVRCAQARLRRDAVKPAAPHPAARTAAARGGRRLPAPHPPVPGRRQIIGPGQHTTR
jgi:hypothetical protein